MLYSFLSYSFEERSCRPIRIVSNLNSKVNRVSPVAIQALVIMAMANVQSPPKTLHEIFSMIADGYMQEAMHTAHIAADSFRKHQDNQSAQWAGKIWTIANTFGEIQQIVAQEKMNGVKEKAALIGTLTRALMGSGEVCTRSCRSCVGKCWWLLGNG